MSEEKEIDVERLLGRLVLGDPTAAPEIRALGQRLLDLADALESQNSDPYAVPSGMSDRVKIRVTSPDGTHTDRDTGADR